MIVTRILCVLGLHRWRYEKNWSSEYRSCIWCRRDEQWREVPGNGLVPFGKGWASEPTGRYAWLHLAPLTDEERAEREREPGKPWRPRISLHRR